MNAKSPNVKKLGILLRHISESQSEGHAITEVSDARDLDNVTRALVDFSRENFAYICDLADAYDERDAER